MRVCGRWREFGGFVMLAVSGLMAPSFSGLGASVPAQDSVPISTRTFLLGLSHHPAHRPGETPQDVQQAMAAAVGLAAQNSEVFAVWTLKDWYEEWEGYYAKPSVAQRRAYFDLLARHHHLTPIFNIKFWTIVPKSGRGLVLELVVPPESWRNCPSSGEPRLEGTTIFHSQSFTQ